MNPQGYATDGAVQVAHFRLFVAREKCLQVTAALRLSGHRVNWEQDEEYGWGLVVTVTATRPDQELRQFLQSNRMTGYFYPA